MNLNEKITLLRKQKGWSQEELAFRLNLSRQAVSKWESGASLPDLENVIQMCELFDITTDYLLKDEDAVEDINKISKPKLKQVSKEEAEEFMAVAKKAYWKIALGVVLCLLSPIALIALTVSNINNGASAVMGTITIIIGIIVLLVMVCVAVSLFVKNSVKLSPYSYLKTEPINLDSETRTYYEDEKKKSLPRFGTIVAIGASLCILSIIPLCIAAGLEASADIIGYMVCLLLTLLAGGTFLLLYYGQVQDSYSKLLQINDYSLENKKVGKISYAFISTYWLLATYIYLVVSFATKAWNLSWLIFAIAGIIFPLVQHLPKIFSSKNKK